MIASGTLGILAPSETTFIPFFIKVSPSSPEISFYVAHGKAISAGMCQGLFPYKN